MKTLIHGQQVKLATFKHQPKVYVQTLTGICKERNEDVDKAMQLAKMHNHCVAWTYRSPAVLTADYSGKKEAIEQNKINYNNAILLTDREIVEIEGQHYTVIVVGSRAQYSDPIHFKLIED